jgi:hypothetical protein
MPKLQLPRTTVEAPAKAFHQHGRDFLLAGRCTVVRALGGDLVDVVDGAEADRARIEHVVDEGLAVLARLALIGRDLVDAEILVVERIARHLAVVVDHAGEHLDQDGLAGARRTVADEGEQEPAQFHERIELAVEIIGHDHARQPHRLMLGEMVTDDLTWLLETA